MYISDKTLVGILNKSGKISPEQLIKLSEEAKDSEKNLKQKLIDDQVLSNTEITKLYADYIGTSYIELDVKNISKETLNILPERIARQYRVVAFDIDEAGFIKLAMEDPDDVQALEFIKKHIGNKYRVYIASDENIQMALEGYRDGVDTEISKVIASEDYTDKATETPEDEADFAEDSPVAQTVNLILEYAVRGGASDIHIEPREEYVQIRYRIDGVLKEANRLPRNVLGALVSRIKILSNLKIDERRVPQDGRFKINVTGKKFALRVSTLPITDGEKVVMRLLDESNKALTLEELGYWGKASKDIRNAIVQPHGMILVTGPTGSGKSTSLFSVLTMLNTPQVNISTIEDPVEYKIFGANQTQVNTKAGMTFAGGLRALLRQDPNIIMVGEIRDGETANLGVQAALTGHLVFSTLHTNNAATCLPRLLDMKIEPFLIASIIRAVVGQRLLRKLCKDCKQSYSPDKSQLEALAQNFHLKNSRDFELLHQLDKKAFEQGVGKDITQLGSNNKTITKLWKANIEGCKNCDGSGFKGRMGIYEVLSNSSEIQRLIIGNATSESIQDQAVKEGMVTMQMDGLVKSLRGQTSVEEILRVTRE